MSYQIRPCRKIQGTINLPGDKSISHRAVIISSIAKGKTLIKNFSFSEDCKATLKALQSLGVKINKKGKNNLIVSGVGMSGFKKPKRTINVSESGTTMRTLIGLLSAQKFSSKLDGEESLRKRPMLRVIKPLRIMGAHISARVKNSDEYPPILISPSSLKPLDWKMYVPSAQVKSAILLAGLYTYGRTRIYEPIKSRDHTERMLRYFGADIRIKGKNIYINPSNLISPKVIYIPRDISSASFFMVLACLLKDSYIKIKNLCLNPSRLGLINILKKMGADIKIINKKNKYFEPTGDITISSSQLRGVTVEENLIPAMVDELPILMVAASFSKGKSIFRGIQELRLKETDRINSMVRNLSKMGAKIIIKNKTNKTDMQIEGCNTLKGAQLNSFGDHRTAMSMVIAAILANSPSKIDDIKYVRKSFPDFFKILTKIIQH